MGPAAEGVDGAEAPAISPALQEAAAAALQEAGWVDVAEDAGEPAARRHG